MRLSASRTAARSVSASQWKLTNSVLSARVTASRASCSASREPAARGEEPGANAAPQDLRREIGGFGELFTHLGEPLGLVVPALHHDRSSEQTGRGRAVSPLAHSLRTLVAFAQALLGRLEVAGQHLGDSLGDGEHGIQPLPETFERRLLLGEQGAGESESACEAMEPAEPAQDLRLRGRVTDDLALELLASDNALLDGHRAHPCGRGEPAEDVSPFVESPGPAGVLGRSFPRAGGRRDAPVAPVGQRPKLPGAGETMLVADSFEDHGHAVDDLGNCVRGTGRGKADCEPLTLDQRSCRRPLVVRR